MAPRYTDDLPRKPPAPAWDQTQDFGALLEKVLLEQGDVASEATQERCALLIAKHWRQFNQHQSPLSTWNMISKCAETKLKIRLASKKTGDDQAKQELEAFEAMMRDVFAQDDDVARTVEHPERTPAEEGWDEEDDAEEEGEEGD